MPIFMDRHDVPGSTAEDIAEAHRKHVEIQDKYGIKYMTYWHDAERGTGFCLVDAPDAATAAHVHREAHGQIPSSFRLISLPSRPFLAASCPDQRATPPRTYRQLTQALNSHASLLALSIR
jgi:hypothetical protein